MSALTRTLARITVALIALVTTAFGTAAFASVPVPDPTGIYNGGSDRGHPVSTLTDAAPPLQHHAQAAVSGVSTLTVLLLIGGALIVAVVAAAGFRQMRGHGQTRTATA